MKTAETYDSKCEYALYDGNMRVTRVPYRHVGLNFKRFGARIRQCGCLGLSAEAELKSNSRQVLAALQWKSSRICSFNGDESSLLVIRTWICRNLLLHLHWREPNMHFLSKPFTEFFRLGPRRAWHLAWCEVRPVAMSKPVRIYANLMAAKRTQQLDRCLPWAIRVSRY